jgi:hypothetical protein
MKTNQSQGSKRVLLNSDSVLFRSPNPRGLMLALKQCFLDTIFNNDVLSKVFGSWKTHEVASLHSCHVALSPSARVGEHTFHSSALAEPLPNLPSANSMKLNIMWRCPNFIFYSKALRNEQDDKR